MASAHGASLDNEEMYWFLSVDTFMKNINHMSHDLGAVTIFRFSELGLGLGLG